MKKYILIVAMACVPFIAVHAQLSGYVYGEDGDPVWGAKLRLVQGRQVAHTDADGFFSFRKAAVPDSVFVTSVGYISATIWLTETVSTIGLQRDEHAIEEVQVVNTGFYQIPKERATGSFAVIDNALLNRSVGGDILQRLEGIASGVQFVNPGGSEASDIRVRGLASIQSDATPLIVVDNFPYDGDITSINPGDIEHVTVLKDAAAASIWGARAGNGVIVITTKQGRYNQKGQFSLNSDLTVGQKPDLLYSRDRLPSETVMQIEKEKYEQGGYYLPNNNQIPFPEYVEMLIARDAGTLSEEEFLRREAALKRTEVREEAMKYLYQPAVAQRYGINARGGGERFTYYMSGGYDRNRDYIIGNRHERINLNMQNTFKPFGGMEISSSLWYSGQDRRNNGLSIDDLTANLTHVRLSPYTPLQDGSGKALSLARDYRLPYIDGATAEGLLDWHYRPLEERDLIDRRTRQNELRANTGLRYSFLQNYNLQASYQYLNGHSQGETLYGKDSYYVRNLVNRFTQANGSRMIPYAGILQLLPPLRYNSHSGRIQFNYTQQIAQGHEVVALIGSEIRQSIEFRKPGATLYNYDPDLMTGTANYNYAQSNPVRPNGNGRIPAPSSTNTRYIDRYLSYFGNASYSFREKYILSGSLRWDGSNLFGVKTNQKGVPLWSIGSGWDIGAEEWFRPSSVDHLKLRLTYGVAGNVNKLVSAYPTIGHWGSHITSHLDYASILSIGNPSLRWEQVATANIGADFRLWQGRLSGSIDYYIKNAHDLIGADILPPSTGIVTGGTALSSNLVNYADMRTKGLDIQVRSRNLNGAFQWNNTLLFHLVRNEVTRYKASETGLITLYTSTDNPPPREGKSKDLIYALPTYRLDPADGTVMMYVDGERERNAATYINSLAFEDLEEMGVVVPPFYGSLLNDFSWKGLNLSFMLTWRAGHVFRRSTHGPGLETSVIYHMDYLDRWQKPGDEQWTDVPAISEDNNENLKAAQRNFANFVSRGDHVRLQDISMSYLLPKSKTFLPDIRQVRIYGYARNLGVLWKKEKSSLDPDYPNTTTYLVPKTFAIGLQMNF